MLPRKRRTRQHIIADQSVNYLERFIIDEGHVAHLVQTDYGYDLFMQTFDQDGYLEPLLVIIQLKATDSPMPIEDGFAFDLDVSDYNTWIEEPNPVFLILFDATRRKAYWLFVQQYFSEDLQRMPKPGAKSIRIRIERRNVVNRRAIAKMRILKNEFATSRSKG